MGEEVPLGAAPPVGLPDAPGRHDRGVVRQVPQAAGLHPEGREAQPRLRDLRARRLLRLPQDQGLREREEARADPDQDRLEALAGLGQELDPQSEGGQADHLDAAVLLQLEQQRSRGHAAQRSGDQRDRRLSLRQRRQARIRREESRARRRQARRGDRQADRLSGLPRRRRRIAIGGRPAPHLRPAAREHRQQDDLRVDLQLGPRSEALQPGDLHAEPAPDRRAGG